MGTVCLSVAPILRCQALTRFESGTLLIPTALELLFSVCLIYAKRGSGRSHLFLATEGLVYFALALLDLLSHLELGASTSLPAFKGLDIFIGVLSFLPLFLYTVFLFAFTTNDILSNFPKRVQTVTRYTLLVFIPVIVVFNELSSFIDLSYRLFQTATGPILVIGFTDDHIRIFLDSVVLFILVAFQATCFCVAFLRLIKAFINQRRIETDSEGTSEHEVHLFNGLGWVAGGIKLGAIESVIGFAGGGYGGAITRKVLRFLSRACLVIGVVKGVDTIEDFRMFESKPRQRQTQRRSMLRALISNPRNSTFRQVDGYQFSPYHPPPVMSNIHTIPILTPATPTQPKRQSRPISRTLNSLPPRFPSPIAIFPSQQRVIVREGRDRAPTLYMRRVSEIDVVSALETAKTLYDDGDELVTSPHHASVRDSGIASIYYTTPYSIPTSPPAFMEVPTKRSSARHTIAAPHNTENLASRFVRTHRVQPSSPTLPRHSTYSAFSSHSESIGAIRALADQFPGLPPRPGPNKLRKSNPHLRSFLAIRDDLPKAEEVDPSPTIGVSRSASERSQSTLGGGSLVRRSSSVKRKPVPKDIFPDEKEMDLKAQTEVNVVDVIDIKPTKAEEEVYVEEDKDDGPPMEVILERTEIDSNESRPASNFTHSTHSMSTRTMSTRSERPMAGIPSLPSTLPTPSSRLSFASQSTNLHAPPSRRTTQLNKNRGMLYLTSAGREARSRTSRITLEFPWHGSDVGAEAEAELQAAREMNGLGRIKSIGRAPRRKTPKPIKVMPYRRESILIECFDDGASLNVDGSVERPASEMTDSDASTTRTSEMHGSNFSDSVEVGQSFLNY